MRGWALINVGGVQMTAEFVNSQFSAPRPDCSVPISLSMKINESGGMISGPYSYVGVIAGDVSALEKRPVAHTPTPTPNGSFRRWAGAAHSVPSPLAGPASLRTMPSERNLG